MCVKFTNCPVCLSSSYRVLYRNAVDRMHGLPGIFKYVRCDKCEHVYLNPRPESHILGSFYPIDYGPHTPLPATSVRRTIAPFSLSPVKRTERFLEKHIEKNSSVLDIGCGRGDFLANLRYKTGCQCKGIDFSANAVRIARDIYDLEVFCGQLVDAPYLDKSFDVITMWWYLEHDPRPIDTLLKCKKFLKPNGLLVFGVPNYRSFNAKLFSTRWYHLDAPRHLSIFSPKSIRVLMKKTGFMINNIDWDRSTWGLLGSFQYALMGRSYNVPFRIQEIFLCRLLSFPLTLLLSSLRLSDIVTIYCRKK